MFPSVSDAPYGGPPLSDRGSEVMFKLFQSARAAETGGAGAATGPKVLRIDASMRSEGSVTRALADRLLSGMASADPSVTVRDLAVSAPGFVDAEWIGANFTPADDRSPAQAAKLETSDALIAELQAAELIVIGSPIYNFSVPAALKAWIDQVARAGVTFRYTSEGPVGLLEGKRVVVLVASGGVPMDSPVDFMTPYLRHVMKFIGITDVTVIAADGLSQDAEKRAAADVAVDAEAARLVAALAK